MKIGCSEVPKPTYPSLLWPAEWKAPAPFVKFAIFLVPSPAIKWTSALQSSVFGWGYRPAKTQRAVVQRSRYVMQNIPRAPRPHCWQKTFPALDCYTFRLLNQKTPSTFLVKLRCEDEKGVLFHSWCIVQDVFAKCSPVSKRLKKS